MSEISQRVIPVSNGSYVGAATVSSVSAPGPNSSLPSPPPSDQLSKLGATHSPSGPDATGGTNTPMSTASTQSMPSTTASKPVVTSVTKLPDTPGSAPTAPIHPNAKTTTHINNGTTTTKTNITSPVCKNCKTQTTPLWRRDETGQVLCNACGLFLKLHGRPRPISLKTDTIKSRNRIKQSSGTATPVKSQPHTPELKSRDNKVNVYGSGKKPSSPKSQKKKTNQDVTLTPLLPNGISVPQPKQFAHPIIHHHHHLPHFPHVQPLHYPASTPAQFAPGLQRITSPLLLSTTNSISNARSEKQAASTLETMSQELGPSASFKSNSSSGSNTISGVSLIRKDTSVRDTMKSSIFASVDVNSPRPTLPEVSSGGLPRLNHPCINNKLPGMYYENHRQHGHGQQQQQQQQQQNPSQGGHGQQQSQQEPQHGQGQGQGQALGHQGSQQDQKSNGGQQQSSNEPPHYPSLQPASHEITLLKTRISELELVNDLYRTRIMELEAMEQAARLRERSMRKRLDEMMQLNDLHKFPPQQPTLPSIRNATPPPGSNIVLPSLKREHGDIDDNSSKRPKH
jgi:GATA-binding protein